jgi:hypothetical protein
MPTDSDHLYILQDGTNVDPADCSDVKGVLRAKNGLAVLVDAGGKPQTVGQAAIDNMAVAAAQAGKPEADTPTDTPVMTTATMAPRPAPAVPGAHPAPAPDTKA